jgi:hypothetical protein
MFGLFRNENPAVGFVYFKNAAPPPAEAFGFVRSAGVEVAPLAAPQDTLWALALTHPTWGTATVWLPREMPPVATFLESRIGLTDGERAESAGAGAAVVVTVPAEFKYVLRDRKRLLRFLRTLMADDAVLAVDVASGMPWSRAHLDEELAHDADLDVEALYVFHAVERDGGGVDWLHTHGLAELGGFDLDILRPDKFVVERANDPLRALAFAMIEGSLKESTPTFQLVIPDGNVRLVPAAEFMRDASRGDRALRTMEPGSDDAHDTRRSVVCEPAGKGLFKSGKTEPSRLLSRGLEDGAMLNFTTAATELMAERARGTVAVFRGLVQEFAELPVTPLVKLGFRCARSGGTEHLWFEVHSVDADSTDCTLVNQPFDVPELHEGLRAVQSLERLTDWTMLSPAGDMTPRSTASARILRSIPDPVRRQLIELKQTGKG